MSLAVQHASIAAWGDEAHVRENRAQYREKFEAVVPMLAAGARRAGAPTPASTCGRGVPGGDDEAFARELFAATHVTVLPGRYLAREAHGENPGRGYVRIALVPGDRRVRRGRAAHRGVLPRVLPLTTDQTVHADTSRSKPLIDAAFERRADITPGQRRPRELLDALDQVIDELNAGTPARGREDRRRVGDAPVDQEGRAAVLPHARQPGDAGPAAATRWFDKVPLRFDGYTDAQFREGGFRVVPPAPSRAPARSSAGTSC